MEVIHKPVLVLIGPTAVGKTDLSIGLAKEFNCEIVSMDSMQVYRYMDIGTAKPDLQERGPIPHHLIDIVDPDDSYNAARFCQDCLESIAAIHARGALPLLTGGTGLYLKALSGGLFPSGHNNPLIRENLEQRLAEEGSEALHKELRIHDPTAAARIMVQDQTRIIRALEVFLNTGRPLSQHLEAQAQKGPSRTFSSMLSIGITCNRDELYRRINERSGQMLEMGLETEVRELLDRGYSAELKSMQAIGYRHMIRYIDGDWERARTLELLARDTRHYAKRQYTWFTKDQSIEWFDRLNRDSLFESVRQWLDIEENRT